MAAYGTGASLLREQYGTADRLKARIDVHARYGERQLDFYGIVLDQLQQKFDVARGERRPQHALGIVQS